jgi:death-on-curing protein
VKYLTKNQIPEMHDELCRETGGLNGLKDEGMLESALAAPLQSFDGSDIYPTVEQKAARLGFGLTANHPFIDGNKRIGCHAMLVLLMLNGINLSYTQEELSDTFLSIASGKITDRELLIWIIRHESD